MNYCEQCGLADDITERCTVAEDKVRKLRSVLMKVAFQTERIEKPCPGNHSYYSSMHPNADATCPLCGNSEDGLGRDLVSYEPTALAKEAIAVLEKI